MAESKLGIYQLAGAYSPPRGLGKPLGETAVGKFFGVSNFGDILKVGTQIAGAVGGVQAMFQRGQSGQTTQVNGQSIPPEMMTVLAQMIQANQQGGQQAAQQVIQREDNKMMELLMMKMMADDKPKNNTGLYIGLGVGGLLLIGLIAVIAMKK